MLSLLKSSIKEIFKNKLSFLLIIIFFILTFGVLFGNISANHRFKSGIYNTGISQNLYQANVNTETIDFIKDSNGQYSPQTLDEFFIEPECYENYFVNLGTTSISEDQLIDFIDIIEGETNYWENNKWMYASDLDTYLLLYAFENYSSLYGISYTYQTYYLKSDTTNPDFEKYQIFIRGNDKNNNYYEESIFQNWINDQENNIVNTIDIVEGNLPKEGEIAINASFAEANDIKVGDVYQGYIVSGLVRFPNFLYPAMSISHVNIDYSNQSIILMSQEDYHKNSFSTFSIKDLNSTIYYGFDDIYENVHSYKSFIKQENNITDKVNEFNNFLSQYFEIDINFNSSQLTYEWFNLGNLQNYRVLAAFNRAEATKAFNEILLFIFFIIFVVIFYINLKKKINSQSKQLGTLKALGVSSNKTSLLFVMYPFFVVVFGFIFAFGFGMFIHSIWFTVSVKYFDLSFGSMFGWLSWLMITVIPIILFVSISFLLSKLMLKKNTLLLINNVVKNKPNFLIPLVSKPLKKTKFTTTYTIKNGLRSITKSSIIVFSLFFSMFLIILSFSLGQSFPRVIESVSENITFNQLSTYYNSPNKNYYITFDWEEAIENNESIYNTFSLTDEYEGYQLNQIPFVLIDSKPININSDLENQKEIFATEVIDNLISNPIVEEDDENEVINIYYLDSNQVLNLISWEFYFVSNGEANFSLGNYYNGSNSSGYENLYSSTIFKLSNMFMVKSASTYIQLKDIANINFLDSFNNTRIYFDTKIYDPNFEDLASSSIIFDKEAKLSSRLYMFNSVEELNENYSLVDSNGKSISSALDSSQSNSEYDYVPIIIPEYLKIVSNEKLDLNKEATVTLSTSNISADQEIEKDLEINVKVVGVYSSYLPIGSFLIKSDLTNYLQQNYGLTNISYNDNLSYNKNANFSQLYNPFLTVDSKIEYYQLNNSGTKSLYLIDESNSTNIYYQPIQYLTNSKVSITSESIIKKSLSSLGEIMNLVILIFALVTMMIGITLIFIFLKEIIDSLVDEVSILKVFGYGSFRSTIMAVIPYIIIILFTFFVSVPIILILLTLLANLIFMSSGIVIPLYPSILQIFFTAIIIFGSTIIMLTIGYFIFKKVSAIRALQMDN